MTDSYIDYDGDAVDPPGYETHLDHQFWQYHRENPQVYAKLVELARQARARGKFRLSIKMLFEVLRWYVILETTDSDWKLNNNYHSRYARLLMHQELDLRGMFELRELKS